MLMRSGGGEQSALIMIFSLGFGCRKRHPERTKKKRTIKDIQLHQKNQVEMLRRTM